MRNDADKRRILPFFIPMQGCGKHCIYCDQWSISGTVAVPSPDQVRAATLAYDGEMPVQVAFYGGSFTALARAQQQAYLQAVQAAIVTGQVDSIRVSTRPDAISQDALDLLADYRVTVVELGIQSFDAEVLQAAGRGYTPEEAADAARLVRAAGFCLGIQLMTGLPRDSRRGALASMFQTGVLEPQLVRFYPTIVLANTPLATLYASGIYEPQTLAEAAHLCGDLLAIAKSAEIPVARMGLNPSPSVETAYLAGPYHPAFGQLARGALKLRQAKCLLDQLEEPVLLRFPRAERSLLCGQQNSQLRTLQSLYAGLEVAESDLPVGVLAARCLTGAELVLPEKAFVKQHVAGLEQEVELDSL